MLADDPTLVDARSGLDETPLHDCAVENGLEAVRFLLAHGASPDPRNFAGNSPLQECAGICRPEWDLTAIIDLLLRSGADPYHSSPVSPCAWHCAQSSACTALRSLFSAIPPPTGPHEDCGVFDVGAEGEE